MELTFFTWMIGLIFIGAGFLVRRYPGTLAGYNTLKPEKKAQVDIDGLTRFIRRIMVGAGVLMIVVFHLFRALGMESEFQWSFLPIIVFWSIVYIIGCRKYSRKKQNPK